MPKSLVWPIDQLLCVPLAENFAIDAHDQTSGGGLDMSELQSSHQFHDPRYEIGEEVRINMISKDYDAPVSYMKSEQRGESTWIMVRNKTTGCRWVRDEWVSWIGVCGSCAKPCQASDYLCPPCRATEEGNNG